MKKKSNIGMGRTHFIFGAIALLVLSIIGCGGGEKVPNSSIDSAFVFIHEPSNAVYHWKTVFAPNTYEMSFMKEHEVKRMYVKFFEVGTDNLYNGQGEQPVPIATTIFKQSSVLIADNNIEKKSVFGADL